MEEHKRIEQRRYDDAAAPYLQREPLPDLGAAGVPPEYRPPYAEFEREIATLAKPGAVVVDIGAGTGAFSLSARGGGRVLVATDISPVALAVARRRGAAAGFPLNIVCADAERLPLRDGAVDLVTAAGVLYCLDLDAVTSEIRRVLRPDGAWVIVDSLDDNPLYRVNRWIGFVRGRRTSLAVENIPTAAAVEGLRRGFQKVAIAYHGILAFLLPILKPLLGPARAGRFVEAADGRLRWMRKLAFKVVVVAQHPR